MTVSKCYCYYGYGGEACAQRVVSYASMLWQVLLCEILSGVTERTAAIVGIARAGKISVITRFFFCGMALLPWSTIHF